MSQLLVTVARSALVCSLGIGSMGLFACGGGESSLGDSPTLSGQLTTWNTIAAAGTITATLSGKADAVATGTIDAAGNFSIVLPGRATLTTYLPEQTITPADLMARPPCTGSYQVSPTTFRSGAVTLTAVSGDKSKVMGQKIPSATNMGVYELVTYIYVDRDVTETGEADCPSTASTPAQTAVDDAHFKAGWNQLISSANSIPDKIATRIYTGTVPASAVWF